MPGLAV